MDKRCYICGKDAVIWQDDFDAEQIEPDEIGIYHDFICQNCGARIRVFEPLEKSSEYENWTNRCRRT